MLKNAFSDFLCSGNHLSKIYSFILNADDLVAECRKANEKDAQRLVNRWSRQVSYCEVGYFPLMS